MGQEVTNTPLPNYDVKVITDANSSEIQEISIASLLSIRVDDTGTYIYLGYALPGANEAAASWRISRYTKANVSALMWADGDTDFNNIWDDRATLSYL